MTSGGFSPALRSSLIALSMLLLTACGSGSGAIAPVGQLERAEPTFHTVQRGDTLYYIAWRYAKDYQHIARINALAPPYTIFPGQRLRLSSDISLRTQPSASVRSPTPSSSSSPAVSSTQPNLTPQPAAVSAPTAATTTKSSTSLTTKVAPRVASSPVGDDAAVHRWQWPTRGTLLSAFGANDRNGIEIGGQEGQPIAAAASGTVVYSGSGLIGYGRLIIIKHNNEYLSAYAHNARLLVNEGDRVDIGQQIGEMGSTGADRVKLHFEIRRDGKPVDPLRYLPG